MIDAREQPPFAQHALLHELVLGLAQLRLHELDRDNLDELAIGTLGAIHDAHASVAELAGDAIRTDTSTGIDHVFVVRRNHLHYEPMARARSRSRVVETTSG